MTRTAYFFPVCVEGGVGRPAGVRPCVRPSVRPCVRRSGASLASISATSIALVLYWKSFHRRHSFAGGSGVSLASSDIDRSSASLAIIPTTSISRVAPVLHWLASQRHRPLMCRSGALLTSSPATSIVLVLYWRSCHGRHSFACCSGASLASTPATSTAHVLLPCFTG